MKLLYGTGNLAKLSAMRNRLEQLDIFFDVGMCRRFGCEGRR